MSIDIILAIAGLVIGIITGVICPIIQRKLYHPRIPFHYDWFCGYKEKSKGIHVIIIRNGPASYTRYISTGFVNRAVEAFEKTRYALCFHERQGFPCINEDEENKELINEVLEKYRGANLFIVTIGTQVSISANNHAPDNIPIIAIGVGAPEECGLNNKKDNIAVVRYGVSIERRIDFLRELFSENGRKAKFFFIYNEDIKQDAILSERVRKYADKLDDISIELHETKSEHFSSEWDQKGRVYFGFYHLNNHFTTFLREAKHAVFVGLNLHDTRAGAVASTENNDYELGRLAVDKILIPKIIHNRPLCKIKLQEPEPFYTLDKKVVSDAGLEFTEKAEKRAREIIMFRHNYN